MICLQCGKEVPDRAFVCGYCGTHLKAAATQSPPISKPVKSQEDPPQTESVQHAIESSTPDQEQNLPEGQGLSAEPLTTNREFVIILHTFLSAWLIIVLGWTIGGYSANLFRMQILNDVSFGMKFGMDTALLIGMYSSILMCLIGGIFTALSFVLISKKMNILLAILLCLGWISSGILMGLDVALLRVVMGVSYWRFAGFLFGGLVTALIIKHIFSALRWNQFFLITLSWLVGSIPSILIASLTSAIFRSGIRVQEIPFAFNLLSGLLIGVICGGLTLLVVRGALHRSKSAHTQS